MSLPLSEADRISRHGWALWSITFAVVLALTAAVVLLYYPVLQFTDPENDNGSLETAYYSVVGLGGLMLVFCLYTAYRQIELERLRRALMNEAKETDDARTRLSELSTLFQVSTTLNLQLRLDVILEIIVRRVVSSMRAQQASIMIYNPESGILETRASYGLESEFARNARKRMGEGIAGWVAEHQQAVMLPAQTSEELDKHFKNDRNITSALSLPLRVGDRCVGVLNVNRINHSEPFGEHHRDMLNLFSEHVGAVIDRAEVMERLGNRSLELERNNLKLTEMNQMKDLFLSTASHELRTPLTSVIAYAELLDDNENKLSKEQRGEFLRRLRDEAERVLSLIEDILDLTRLEVGKFSLRRAMVPLNEVIHAAVETTRSMAVKHGVEVRERYRDSLPPVLIDEVKMRQVFVNLLANAIKFSPERGVVIVHADREPKYLRVEVTDKGLGVSPEEATHIFEMFGQGTQRDGRGAGLGIGLQLVKRITELHGGHVGVNSLPGEGSHFWVRLPLALADATETTAPARELAESNAA
jgi:signal transduction histidine kinase